MDTAIRLAPMIVAPRIETKPTQAGKATAPTAYLPAYPAVLSWPREAAHIGAHSDEELMSLVASGRTDAIEALYERHVRGCFGLAMKIVHDPTLAEEVVQDVFVKLWSRPSIFSAERGKFSGWLLTLVHNRAVDKLRRAGAGLSSLTVSLDMEGESGLALSDLLSDDAPSPDEIAWSNEKAEMVRRALGKLPEAQRLAIQLAYFAGLTQKEIAERLSEPLGTIKTRTRSGLQQLRRLLAGSALDVEGEMGR